MTINIWHNPVCRLLIRAIGGVCLFFGLLAIVSGCAKRGNKGIGVDDQEKKVSEDIVVVEPDTVNIVSDLTSIAQNWSDSIMSAMTLEQRVGQILLPAVYAESDEYSLRKIRHYMADLHVGGVVLLKGNPESIGKIAGILGAGENPPPFIAMDAEWGLGMRLKDTPVFPRNGLISPEADQGIIYEYGREVARECRLAGINMVLGPVADVATEKGRMGGRSFGTDPARVGEMTVAYARGLEDGNVLSVAKHFPGHGSTSTDSHLGLPVIGSDNDNLHSRELYPFRIYIESGLSGIMAGHLAVPAIDSTMSPASFSRPLLTDLLRGELGFRGLILTDALNMGGASGYNAADAIKAGADIVLAPGDTEYEFREIIRQVERGVIPVGLINDRCRRILFYKFLIKRESPTAMSGLRYLNTQATDSLKYQLQGRR